MTVLRSLPASAQNPAAIAADLRALAAQVETGGLGAVANVTVLVESRTELIAHALLGHSRSSCELAGLFFLAARLATEDHFA